jgi:hypothetical protein
MQKIEPPGSVFCFGKGFIIVRDAVRALLRPPTLGGPRDRLRDALTTTKPFPCKKQTG